tara:strand:+ start:392 stop:532 length:141 start_codon:yes stop_codon:yes gene_type:complete
MEFLFSVVLDRFGPQLVLVVGKLLPGRLTHLPGRFCCRTAPGGNFI